MSDTHYYSLHDTAIDEDALLDCSNLSHTELDYEFTDSILETEAGKSEVKSVVSDSTKTVTESLCPKSSRIAQCLPQLSQKIAHTDYADTRSIGKSVPLEKTRSNINGDFEMNENDYNSTSSDVLDLQRMADKFAENKNSKLRNMEGSVFEAGRFNYDVVTTVDKLLEEAHDICYKYNGTLNRTTRARLLNMILALNDLPHLYQATSRENGMSTRRVREWLASHTGQPEPEMVNFMGQNSVQLRKFVSDIKPRVSTSDTNVTLGKRKRASENYGVDDVTGVHGSSSDTRVYAHADWSRSRVAGKRRKIKK